MILLFLLTGAFNADIEFYSGFVCPAATASSDPAVFFEPAAVVEMFPGWELVIGVPFWRSEDYSPDGEFPEYTGIPQALTHDMYSSYGESFTCIQAGVRKGLGPLDLRLSGGMIDREFETFLSGVGKSDWYRETYSTSDMTGALEISFKVGSAGILAAGTRYCDGEWAAALSTGISISRLIGGSE